MRLITCASFLAACAVFAADRRVSIDCHAQEATCASVLEAVQTGAKAEKWAIADDALLRLRVVVTPHAVLFELGDEKGLRLITHTDAIDYRAPHATADGLFLLSVLTVILIPPAVELLPPTTLADKVVAWTAKTRQVLRKGAVQKQRWTGPGEVRGARWVITVGTVRVLRRAEVEELMVLDGDDDFEELAPDAQEAMEADYAARLVLPALVGVFDAEDGLKTGDGKATVIIQSLDGRFLPNMFVKGNPDLGGLLRTKGLAVGMPAFPLKGATRVLVPITVRRRR